LLDWPWW